MTPLAGQIRTGSRPLPLSVAKPASAGSRVSRPGVVAQPKVHLRVERDLKGRRQ